MMEATAVIRCRMCCRGGFRGLVVSIGQTPRYRSRKMKTSRRNGDLCVDEKRRPAARVDDRERRRCGNGEVINRAPLEDNRHARSTVAEEAQLVALLEAV